MKKAGIFALVAIAALALSGCTDSEAPTGDSTSTGDAGSTTELTPVTVGVIPIADTAPLYLGDAQGFFEEEGLDLTIETATGGAAIVPSSPATTSSASATRSRSWWRQVRASTSRW